MTDEQNQTPDTDQGDADRASQTNTSPPGGKTHEATTPPGQGDRDEEASKEAQDRLEQAGGGH